MNRILFFSIFILFLNNVILAVEVIRVIDGDTFVLENNKVVRMLGIDAPEITRGKNEYYGYQSKKYLEDLILNKDIKLTFEKKKHDRFYRLLAYVYTKDNKFVNLEMVKNGYAYVLRKYPFKYMQLFLEFERDAYVNRRGLWKNTEEANKGLKKRLKK